MTNDKKKSTPEGALISNQEHNNTPSSDPQAVAEILLGAIDNSDRPMSRPNNASVDRCFRKLIEERNNSGDDCIINIGEGYFRPVPGEEVDEWAYGLYRARAMKKIKSEMHKLHMMDKYMRRGE